jgi:hypothetical protein
MLNSWKNLGNLAGVSQYNHAEPFSWYWIGTDPVIRGRNEYHFAAPPGGSFLNLVRSNARRHTRTLAFLWENYVKRVRVLVANRPRPMRELVIATISDQPDIELVGEVIDEGELTEVVEQVQPDVLILAMNDPEKSLGQCGFLLGRYPQMRILALAPEQNRGIFYWAIVDIRTKPLESSEAGILNAVRERPMLVGATPN